MSTWRVRCRSICDAEAGGAGKRGSLFVGKGDGASESFSDFVSVTTRRRKGMGVDMGKEERAGMLNCALEWPLVLRCHRGKIRHTSAYTRE